MAFLVCYHNDEDCIDWSNKAIYLDQSFYQLMQNYLKKEAGESILKNMVSIGYDDECIIAAGKVKYALIELTEVVHAGNLKHAQIQQLADVFKNAISNDCGLAIGGDMYPDLSSD